MFTRRGPVYLSHVSFQMSCKRLNRMVPILTWVNERKRVAVLYLENSRVSGTIDRRFEQVFTVTADRLTEVNREDVFQRRVFLKKQFLMQIFLLHFVNDGMWGIEGRPKNEHDVQQMRPKPCWNRSELKTGPVLFITVTYTGAACHWPSGLNCFHMGVSLLLMFLFSFVFVCCF